MRERGRGSPQIYFGFSFSTDVSKFTTCKVPGGMGLELGEGKGR
jgi:hypothetical protein